MVVLTLPSILYFVQFLSSSFPIQCSSFFSFYLLLYSQYFINFSSRLSAASQLVALYAMSNLLYYKAAIPLFSYHLHYWWKCNFQAGAPFSTDNARLWPILARFSYSVAKLRAFWCTFTGLNHAVVYQN